MADRYQDRPFPADAEHDRGAVRRESDPLWELAQLTGQTRSVRHPGQDPRSAAVAGQCPSAIRPRGGRRARPLGRRHGGCAPGRKPRHAGIRRAGAGVPEPRASFAPLRSPVSRSVRTGPSRATTRCRRAAWPDQIRRAGKRSRSGLSGRSLRPSTRLRQDGGRCSGARTGRGGDGSCLNLSSLCWLSAQRRAADHQSRQQRDQCGAGPV